MARNILAKSVEVFYGEWGASPLQEERKVISASGYYEKLCLTVSFRFRNAYFPSTVHLIVIVENDEWNLLKLVLC